MVWYKIWMSSTVQSADVIIAEHPSADHLARKLSIGLWAAAALLGLLQAWAERFYIEPDGVNYLDVAYAYLRHDYHDAINAYWSPLYSWLLAVVIAAVHPPPYWESTALHMLNFLDYLLALTCFSFFFRELTRMVQARGEPAGLLPTWAWKVFGYSLFVYASLELVGVGTDTPDLLVEAACFLGTGLILRIRRGESGWTNYAALGVVLGLGYLAKTVMFPLGFVFVFCALLARNDWKRNVPRVVLCFVVFLLIASPWLLTLSRAKGKFTYGEVSSLAYADYINGLMPLSHWHGDIPGLGTPAHSTRRVNEHPPVEEFATPYSVTYAPWYDGSYWDEGVKPHFEWRGQWRVLATTLTDYFRIASAQKGIAVGLFALIFLTTERGRYFRELIKLWPVWLPAAATLGLYALVHVETRFLGAALVILWCCAFVGVRLPQAEWTSRVWTSVLMAVCLAMAVTVAAVAGRDLGAIVKPPRHAEWEAARELMARGVRPGQTVTILGHTNVADYWAHLAQVRIVAEIPQEGVPSYWDADAKTRSHVLELLAGTGARFVVTRVAPPASQASDWERLGSTAYYSQSLSKFKTSN